MKKMEEYIESLDKILPPPQKVIKSQHLCTAPQCINLCKLCQRATPLISMVKGTQTYACMHEKRVYIGLFISFVVVVMKVNPAAWIISIFASEVPPRPVWQHLLYLLQKEEETLQREASFHKMNMKIWTAADFATDVLKGFKVSWRYTDGCVWSSDDLRFAWA